MGFCTMGRTSIYSGPLFLVRKNLVAQLCIWFAVLWVAQLFPRKSDISMRFLGGNPAKQSFFLVMAKVDRKLVCKIIFTPSWLRFRQNNLFETFLCSKKHVVFFYFFQSFYFTLKGLSLSLSKVCFYSNVVIFYYFELYLLFYFSYASWRMYSQAESRETNHRLDLRRVSKLAIPLKSSDSEPDLKLKKRATRDGTNQRKLRKGLVEII